MPGARLERIVAVVAGDRRRLAGVERLVVVLVDVHGAAGLVVLAERLRAAVVVAIGEQVPGDRAVTMDPEVTIAGRGARGELDVVGAARRAVAAPAVAELESHGQGGRLDAGERIVAGGIGELRRLAVVALGVLVGVEVDALPGDARCRPAARVAPSASASSNTVPETVAPT